MIEGLLLRLAENWQVLCSYCFAFVHLARVYADIFVTLCPVVHSTTNESRLSLPQSEDLRFIRMRSADRRRVFAERQSMVRRS